jgi:hypothetical protein
MTAQVRELTDNVRSKIRVHNFSIIQPIRFEAPAPVPTLKFER